MPSTRTLRPIDKIYKFGNEPLFALTNRLVNEMKRDNKKMLISSEYYTMYAKALIERFGKIPDWSKMHIKEKTYHGWMRFLLIMTDCLMSGRWHYWFDIRATQEVEGKPIPQIKLHHPGSKEFEFASSTIKRCLEYPKSYMFGGSRLFYLFIDWLLYGLGCSIVPKMPREITDDLNKYWYENFCLDMLLLYPADYFVAVASEVYSNKAFNSGAFYPTPSSVVELMVALTYSNADDLDMREKYKYAAVNEPAMGSGIMLLYQSNYSLRLTGQDIDMLMCKIATVNGYFYMPWLVEGDERTSKLLSDMHDKYWNNNEDEDIKKSLLKSLNILSNKRYDFSKLNL